MKDKEENGCGVVAYQKANVSVPITVKPKITTGDVNTFCYGEPVLKKADCAVRRCDRVNEGNTSCSFVITQSLCVEIPIEFSANAFVQEAHIECDEVEIK